MLNEAIARSDISIAGGSGSSSLSVPVEPMLERWKAYYQGPAPSQAMLSSFGYVEVWACSAEEARMVAGIHSSSLVVGVVRC